MTPDGIDFAFYRLVCMCNYLTAQCIGVNAPERYSTCTACAAGYVRCSFM